MPMKKSIFYVTNSPHKHILHSVGHTLFSYWLLRHVAYDVLSK